MNARTMLICCREKEYARRLAEYIAGKKEYMVRVHYCDQIETGRSLSQSTGVDYLLIDNSFAPEERRQIACRRCFCLTEHPHESAGEGETPVFKFQPAGKLTEQVFSDCADDPAITVRSEGKKTRVAGFFSPVGRCGQTELALAVGRRLAADDAVLYLNLCPYAAGECFDGDGAAQLEDLVYFVRQDAPNIGLRLQNMTGQKDGVEYLKPFVSCSDLKETEGEVWLKMLDELAGAGRYGAILLDLSPCLQRAENLLEVCTDIYMPVLPDKKSKEKEAAFLEELKKAGKSQLVRTIRKVPMEGDLQETAGALARAIGSGDLRP